MLGKIALRDQRYFPEASREFVVCYSGPVGARVIKDVRFQFFFSYAAKCTIEKRGRV